MLIAVQNQFAQNLNREKIQQKRANKDLSFKGKDNFSQKVSKNPAKKDKLSFGENPIGKKLASVIKTMKPDEILLVGDNLATSKKALTESLDRVGNFIKKLFFVEAPEVKNPFALSVNVKGDTEVLNLSDRGIFIHKPDKMSTVLKGQKDQVSKGDAIYSDGLKFKLDEELDAKAVDGVKEFDFSKKDASAIARLNTKNLEMLEANPNETKAAKKITFADVGGQDEVIDKLKKGILFPMKYPDAFKGSILNKGTILYGGPGTGKSLIAKALSNESDAHYIQVNGAEFETKFVGETEKKWRETFEEARQKQPCIIFIDEADAVMKKRQGSEQSRHDDKTVNQILTLMSDLEKSSDQIHVILATNKVELLDDAITRSGRFGKHIEVKNPGLEGCKQILGIHTKGKPVSGEFKSDEFAKQLHKQNVSGADIAQIANDAHSNANDRAGIYEKMAKGTYTPADTKNLKIEPKDFDKALKDFAESSKKDKEVKNPMGFIWPVKKDQ